MTDLFKELLDVAEDFKITMAFVAAGGAADLFGLFRIPGCSRVMLEATMLYGKSSFTSFLGSKPDSKFVSQQMADLLSTKLQLKTKADLCFAVTCALQTDRQRRGRDHAFISICRTGQVVKQTPVDIQGEGRAEQDAYISRLTIREVLASINE